MLIKRTEEARRYKVGIAGAPFEFLCLRAPERRLVDEILALRIGSVVDF